MSKELDYITWFGSNTLMFERGILLHYSKSNLNIFKIENNKETLLATITTEYMKTTQDCLNEIENLTTIKLCLGINCLDMLKLFLLNNNIIEN